MSIKDKDSLLADYLEGLISEEALIGLYPDLQSELKDIKRAQSALAQLESPDQEKGVIIDFPPPTTSVKNTLFIKLAASILFLVSLVLLIQHLGNPNQNLISLDLEKASTEEKLQAIIEIMSSDISGKEDITQLIGLAVNDDNSNIRYLALQKLADNPPQLTETTILNSLEKEQIINNQIAWIELWVILNKKDPKTIQNWLDQPERHPLVKSHGEQIIKGL
ncbi:MAG: hypothetical protein AAF502_11220 [Bacteroidota bacterium]